MPFPLAHPAAVLPFRRYCPRLFSFPALVVGSIAPDLGYFLGRRDLPEFSHRFIGSILFCLPVGMLAYVLMYQLRSFVLRKDARTKLTTLLHRAWPLFGSLLAVLCSLLVGSWTHLFLDAFTHQHGWLAEKLPWLQVSFGSVAGHAVSVYGLLWFGCSFIGVGLVFLAFRNWQQRSFPANTVLSPRADWRGALLVASAVVPIELLHRLLNNWLGMLLVSILTLLLILAVFRRLWPTDARLRANPADPA